MIAEYCSYLAWGAEGWGDEFFFGFLMTLKVSFCAYSLSALFGLLAACAKLSGSRLLRIPASLYIAIVRSLPELLMVLLVYFTVAGLAESALISFGVVAQDFEFNPFVAAVFALAFVSGGFMAEVLRAARLAVAKGQIEAAMAMGMPPLRIFRRITLPQMMRHAIPGLGNLWLNITKESAIISVLGAFSELLYTGYRAAAATKDYAFFYGLTAWLFLLITLASLALIRLADRYYNRGQV